MAQKATLLSYFCSCNIDGVPNKQYSIYLHSYPPIEGISDTVQTFATQTELHLPNHILYRETHVDNRDTSRSEPHNDRSNINGVTNINR